MLTYLLAIDEHDQTAAPSSPVTPRRFSMPPRSPTSARRRQSLMLLSTAKVPEDIVDPNVFNMVDLIINNVSSSNSQSVYAALRLTSTLITRQKQYSFGTLLKLQSIRMTASKRTEGALQLEVERYSQVAASLHEPHGLDVAYDSLCNDLRYSIEAQRSLKLPDNSNATSDEHAHFNYYQLTDGDLLMRTVLGLLRSFFTNEVDVNLALTEAFIAIAQCAEVRLEGWLALAPSSYRFAEEVSPPSRSWRSQIDDEEQRLWSALHDSTRRPMWPENEEAPLLYRELQRLAAELDVVRTKIPNFNQLLSGRKNMLQATNFDADASGPPSPVTSPTQQVVTPFLDVPSAASPRPSRSSSLSPMARERNELGNETNKAILRAAGAASRLAREGDPSTTSTPSSSSPPTQSVFKPPPPEAPSTTDMLMHIIDFSTVVDGTDHVTDADDEQDAPAKRTATLNHVLTNAVVLQEFVLELVAVLQVRAAVLGEHEVRVV